MKKLLIILSVFLLFSCEKEDNVKIYTYHLAYASNVEFQFFNDPAKCGNVGDVILIYNQDTSCSTFNSYCENNSVFIDIEGFIDLAFYDDDELIYKGLN